MEVTLRVSGNFLYQGNCLKCVRTLKRAGLFARDLRLNLLPRADLWWIFGEDQFGRKGTFTQSKMLVYV